jgi:lysophospholipase L1-like esterase
MPLTHFLMRPRRQVKCVRSLIWYVGLSCGVMVCLDGVPAVAASVRIAGPGAPHNTRQPGEPADAPPGFIFIGLGDSLTHGTMDGTNNDINTLQAYLQKIAESLGQVTALTFSQPLFDVQQNRLQPFQVPTNLSVDAADAFSLEGYSYYKRAGVEESFITDAYLCDRRLPWLLEDTYDKVLYPINLLAHRPVSQLDAAIWHLDQLETAEDSAKALIIFWVGNNDSSTAALGFGGENPAFISLPLKQLKPEIAPALKVLLQLAQQEGALSFEAYTTTTIERNWTELQDFVDQYERLLTRLEADGRLASGWVELFLLTIPYYSSAGYLFDSDDLVLSEAERGVIRERIDGFNAAIKAATASRGPHVHLVDVGQYVNDVLTGVTPVVVDGRLFSRKWIRGSSSTFDGVHPGYTGQAFIGNFLLAQINDVLRLQAPAHDLSPILAADLYVDRDGDGWAPGPDYQVAGLTELLYLFKDPHDADPGVRVELPSDVWDLISRILLRELLGIPSVQQAAERLGVSSAQRRQ